MVTKYFVKKDFDFTTMDIFYIYIPKYKVFESQGFLLQPDFSVTEEKKDNKLILHVERKPDFIDLLTEDSNFVKQNFLEEDNSKRFGLKLRLFAGKNGSGKTSLLNLLSGTRDPDSLSELITLNKDMYSLATEPSYKCIYIFKDSQNRFAATTPCKIYIDSEVQDLKKACFETSTSPRNIKDLCMNNCRIVPFEKGFLEHYLNHKSLYNNILPAGDYFTKFKVKFWNIEEYLKEINFRIRDAFSVDSDFIDNTPINIIVYYFLVNLRSLFHTDSLFYLQNEQVTQATWISQLNDYFTDNEVINNFNALYENNHSIADLKQIVKKLSNYETEIQKSILQYIRESNIIQDFSKEDIKFEVPLTEILYFKGFDEHTYRSLEDFSDGEKSQLQYRYNLYEYLKQNNPVWWYIDEPEKNLHPEWCRRFLNDYVEAYNSVKKTLKEEGNEKVYKRNHTVILTTHSPFILSDLTNDYIIFLNNPDDRVPDNVFLGNIGQLLSNSMFLESTMGEHSKKLINSVINYLNELKDFSNLNKKKIVSLFENIGDELLRNLLLEQVERYEWKE